MQIDRHLADRRRKQQKRRKYFWAIAGFLAAYFIVLGVFVFIVRSPAFRVGQITFEGNSAVATSDIMTLITANLIRNGNAPSGRNNGTKALLGPTNMLIWPDALPSSTIALIPRLAGITMSKNYFFHTITVTVTERQPFAVWCTMPGSAGTAASSSMALDSNEQCFWFDIQGDAFAKTFDTEGGAILVIHDYSQKNIVLGGNVLPVEFLPNLISIVNAIKASGLDIQETALNDLSLEQINVTTVDGPTLYFSLRFPADSDLAVLKSLIAKPGFDKLQYIDFTVQNRAYYK